MNKPVYGAALVRHLETLEPRIVMSVTTVTDTVGVIDEDGNADTFTATIAYDTDDLDSWEVFFDSGLATLGNLASVLEVEGANLQVNPGDNLLTPTVEAMEDLAGTASSDGALVDFFGPIPAYSNNLKVVHSLSSVTTLTEFAAYTENPPDNPTGVNSNATAAARVQEIGEILQQKGARLNQIISNFENGYTVTNLFRNIYYLTTGEVRGIRNDIRALTKELRWIDTNYPNR